MSIYYQDEYATIHLGDCREILPTLGTFGIVVTDPPYSAITHAGARSAPTSPYQGEAQVKINFNSITDAEVRDILARVQCRRWLIATMDWRHIYAMEQQPPQGYRFIRFGVWVKPNSAPQFTGDRPATGWEGVAILHAESEKLKWNGGGHRAVWTHNIDSSGRHPTAKPVSLCVEILKQFALPGETVCDPFCGSGTTLVAAKQMGLKSVGIEISERYCEIAARRLSQGVLAFDAP